MSVFGFSKTLKFESCVNSHLEAEKLLRIRAERFSQIGPSISGERLITTFSDCYLC